MAWIKPTAICELPWGTHKAALGACFWMLIGSFLPILADSLLRTFILDVSFIDSFLDNIKGGEVFLFTSALITPFFWLLIKSIGDKSSQPLPFFGCVFFASLLSFFGGVVCFCYFRIGRLLVSREPNLESIFDFNFGVWAIGIYVVSLLVWYYSTYYENKGDPKYETIRDRQQSNLKQSFQELKG